MKGKILSVITQLIYCKGTKNCTKNHTLGYEITKTILAGIVKKS